MASLLYTFLAFKKNFSDGISGLGLRYGTPKVLYVISTHEGSKQKDIANGCFLETATLSTVLSTLEKRNLIKRIPDEEDKRAYKIYTTNKCKRYLEVIDKQLKETVDTAFDGFTEDEIKQVNLYLDRVYENLNKANQE